MTFKMLNQTQLMQDAPDVGHKKKHGCKSAVLFSTIAILGCAVVALSVVLGITLNKQESITPNHAMSLTSPYNVKFALHEPDVTKDIKPKQGNDVMKYGKSFAHELIPIFVGTAVRWMVL